MTMDAFKGVFRRANQSVKEKTGRAEATADQPLEEAVKRIRLLERQGIQMMDKVNKLNQLFEEIGSVCISLADDYRASISPELTAPEMLQLTEELSAYGQEVRGKAQELSRNLKENAYDNIAAFVREVPQLKHLEEDRKKKQLEYDFFKQKVDTLCRDPPKDSTRIPRNEGIRENWRTQLWQSTENMKAIVSGLVLTGQRVLDASLYTVSMTMGNYAGYALNSAKNHFSTARIPAYNTAPLLPPLALPPPPPPFQQAVPAAYGAYGAPPPGAPPGFGSPQHQHQHQQYASPYSGVGYASPQSQPQFAAQHQHQQPAPAAWNNNTQFGQTPAPPPQQPAHAHYGYDTSAQQPIAQPQQVQAPPPQQPQQWGAPAEVHQQQAAPAQQPQAAPWGQPPAAQQQQPPWGQ